MIYADPSFLCSLYAWDANTSKAQRIYAADARRPLLFTSWQRLEVRNTMRLAVHRLRRSRKLVPFQIGNVLRRIDEDLAAARLRFADPDWRETLRLAEELSAAHTEELAAGAVDLWHIASAIRLKADTFWTFDDAQGSVAKAAGVFKSVRFSD